MISTDYLWTPAVELKKKAPWHPVVLIGWLIAEPLDWLAAKATNGFTNLFPIYYLFI